MREVLEEPSRPCIPHLVHQVILGVVEDRIRVGVVVRIRDYFHFFAEKRNDGFESVEREVRRGNCRKRDHKPDPVFVAVRAESTQVFLPLLRDRRSDPLSPDATAGSLISGWFTAVPDVVSVRSEAVGEARASVEIPSDGPF